MSNTEFDAKNLRRALSQFPTGVTVITTTDTDGNPVGVTASSFNSVSMDPALILWSIDKGANSLSAFQESKYFAVNVLASDQVATSNNFASRGTDKFANAQYSLGLGNAPILEHYAAQFECKTWAVYDGGDHLILVGEVIEYRHNDIAAPLVFARGSYAISTQHPEMIKPAETDNKDNDTDFVNDYLLYLLRETYQRFSADLYPKLNQACDVTPEEWRILARMTSAPTIKVNKLIDMVMQPEDSLRETIAWMVAKELISYLDHETLQATEQGKKIAEQMKAIALNEERQLLEQLSKEQTQHLKASLKAIINKL
ncbi:nitrilotriacetate monooxygenase [Colwellia psychrerythraea]|uniref:Nitrilotriacetate monooxygenase n=1 Tax=Colwellia psychrerythraea TaxID=28229 RepID=A0A1Y5ET56_COLPS|nr:nitrilotriacetate monooxygenase [Colwellia psychrerythraea]